MKSKELKIYNLPSENYLISEIDAKPTNIFIFLAAIGLILLFVQDHRIYGVFMIFFSVIAIAFLPSVPLIEFYGSYLVLYNRADKSKCTMLYYEEISSWVYKKNNISDLLIINLSDGSQEKISAFSRTLFEANMNRFLNTKRLK